MPSGNGLELMQKNTNTPWQESNPGWQQLLQQVEGVYKSNQGKWANGYDRDFSHLGITTPGMYGGLINRAGQTSNAQTNLADIAAGRQIGANPYTSQMIQQNADEAMRRATSGIGAAGRGGSGLAQRNLADTYARATTPYYQQQYENDSNRQLQASGMIDQANLGFMGAENSALNSLTAAQAAQIAGEQGIYDLRTRDPRWDEAQKYAGILSGTNSFGTQETFEPPVPLWQQILGGLASVAGIAGSFMGDQSGMGGAQSAAASQGQQPAASYGYRPRTGILGGYG